GIGIVRDGEVLANVVASQTALHEAFGGVMPEQASREHLNVIDKVCEDALSQANITLAEVDVVAATHGPGLVGALLVGLNYGRALAWGRGIPFVPIHHLEGHIAASNAQPPFLCLIASGGHTSLFDVPAWGHYTELGKSRDDAAGEAFDKVARLLGLGYPGGPALSKLAQQGDAKTYPFTPPLRQQTGFDFSFSGLKTAVATLLKKTPNAFPADVAASFERTVVDSLIKVSTRALKHTGRTRLVVAGGVAANHVLRERLDDLAYDLNIEVNVPPLNLTTDNGAMIALAAWHRLEQGLEHPNSTLQVDAVPYLPLASS
ncbi:MAG: tRNA (adenosine(37)-N6)-threonylcarbamoyltransferase complex transferase subunit TsaD, partial [Deinococcota bacterium]